MSPEVDQKVQNYVFENSAIPVQLVTVSMAAEPLTYLNIVEDRTQAISANLGLINSSNLLKYPERIKENSICHLVYRQPLFILRTSISAA